MRSIGGGGCYVLSLQLQMRQERKLVQSLVSSPWSNNRKNWTTRAHKSVAFCVKPALSRRIIWSFWCLLGICWLHRLIQIFLHGLTVPEQIIHLQVHFGWSHTRFLFTSPEQWKKTRSGIGWVLQLFSSRQMDGKYVWFTGTRLKRLIMQTSGTTDWYFGCVLPRLRDYRGLPVLGHIQRPKIKEVKIFLPLKKYLKRSIGAVLVFQAIHGMDPVICDMFKDVKNFLPLKKQWKDALEQTKILVLVYQAFMEWPPLICDMFKFQTSVHAARMPFFFK